MSGNLSAEIRERADAEWTSATGHRLFSEILDDTVDTIAFERYLRIEFAFIDTAAIALGAAVHSAPGMADRAVLASGLNDLLTSQVAFFEQALANDQSTIVPHSAMPMHALFREVADGHSYSELLAAMLAAEWLYQTWCAKTIRQPSTRATIRAWTELHTSHAFIRHVSWLRQRLDTLSASLTSAERDRVAVIFRRALAAEVSFHDAVYEE